MPDARAAARDEMRRPLGWPAPLRSIWHDACHTPCASSERASAVRAGSQSACRRTRCKHAKAPRATGSFS
eukprot:5197971-Prymnesium_polylepis.1